MNKFRNSSRKIIDRRRSLSEKIFFVFIFFFFVVYSLTVIFVILWSLSSSLKENREFWREPFALPEKWLFSNYIDAFKQVEINDTSLFGMFLNSIWFAFGTILISNFTAMIAGYVFAKYSFKGKGFMFAVNLFTMIVPNFAAGAANYVLIYKLGINDSPLFLLKSFSCLGMGFIVYSSIFKGISNSYIEAAAMDGAGHLTIFFRVIFPQSLPVFIALCTTGVIGAWNDWMTPLYYLEKMPTLASGIYFFQQELVYASNEPLYFASTMMCCVPVIIMFAISQRKIMGSVYAGGLKG